jgi:hypothetical protein
MLLKPLVFALLLAAPFVATAAAPVDAPSRPTADIDRATAQIRTRAELDDFLAGNHAAGNPFTALSPAARERFLASLKFGAKGAASALTSDLQTELSAAQAYRLLALFGLQTALAGMPALRVESDDDRVVEAWRSGVTVPDYFILNAVCTGRSWNCMPLYGGLCWLPCPLD